MIALWVATTPTALAAIHTTTVCVQIDVRDFLDYEIGDFWNGTGGVYQAVRGVRVNIAEYTQAGTFRQMVFEGYASETSGCVTVGLNSQYRYEIAALSKAEVSGVPIEVHDGPSVTDPMFLWVLYGADNRYDPSVSWTMYLRPAYEPALGELAIAAYAMRTNDAGLNSGTWLQLDASACCNGSNQYAIKAASDRKFLIAHELGHGVGRRRDENEPPEVEYDRATDHCSATPWSTGPQGRWEKDWASAALKEGWADFYADWLWNDSSESDCEHPARGEADLDLNGSENDLDPRVDLSENEPFSCEGVPVSGLNTYVGSRDWLADVVNADDSFASPRDKQCNGTLVGVGTSYDASRYFWDMLTDENVSMGTLICVYDSMNPRNWEREIDNVLLGRNPFRRLEDAADACGVLTEHLAQRNNGVNHGP